MRYFYETNNYQTDIWFGEKKYNAFDEPPVSHHCVVKILLGWSISEIT